MIDGYIEAGPVRLHYVREGVVGDKRPILLLHGFPQDWYCWRKVIGPLAKRSGAAVYALDMKGFGDSDKPTHGPSAKYDKETIAGEIRQAMRLLAEREGWVGRSFAVVGHDWGGPVAFLLAAGYPKAVDALVLVDGPTRLPPLWNIWYAFVFNIPGFEFVLDASSDEFIRRGLTGSLVNKAAFNEADIRHFQKAFSSKEAHRAGLAYYRNFVQDQSSLAHTRQRGIRQPTLLVWADQDFALPLSVAKRMHEDMPHARLEVVRNCGHFVPDEQPEQLTDLLAQFLTSSR
jgi:epoxide hydrolase 4